MVDGIGDVGEVTGLSEKFFDVFPMLFFIILPHNEGPMNGQHFLYYVLASKTFLKFEITYLGQHVPWMSKNL